MMRDYAKVSPTFWVGTTGKQLRAAGPEVQILALYLMTSPHSTMTGVYWCPLVYMAHETGLGMEGTSKALASLIEAGFVEHDEASEHVFVVNMASYQIDAALKPNDKRIAGLRKDVLAMPPPMKKRFLEIHGRAFLLVDGQDSASPPEAPPKPLPSKEQEQEQEQEHRHAQPASRGQRLPPGWEPDPVHMAFAESIGLRNGRAATELEKFRDYWSAIPGQKGVKTDWPATWRNWARNAVEIAPSGARSAQAATDPFAGAK